MTLQNRQVEFLRFIGQSIPDHVSLVNVLADLLDVSVDSAYRRLRGETSLTFDELAVVCSHFNVSFDSFNESQQNKVAFGYQSFATTQQSFKTYLNSIGAELKRLAQFDPAKCRLMYAGQGIPIFHYFKYKYLGAFKMYYWMNTIMGVEEFDHKPFSPDLIDDELYEIGERIQDDYMRIPSTEIWTDTTVMGTIRQITFYVDSGLFPNTETALKVYDELEQMLNDIRDFASKGQKNYVRGETRHSGQELELYHCEIEFENNCIFVKAGEQMGVYLGHLSFGSIGTGNKAYCQDTHKWLETLVSKSNLISGVSETQRYQFFRRCSKQMEKLKAHILES